MSMLGLLIQQLTPNHQAKVRIEIMSATYFIDTKNKLETANKATQALKEAFPNEDLVIKAKDHGKFEAWNKDGQLFGTITIDTLEK